MTNFTKAQNDRVWCIFNKMILEWYELGGMGWGDSIFFYRSLKTVHPHQELRISNEKLIEVFTKMKLSLSLVSKVLMVHYKG